MKNTIGLIAIFIFLLAGGIFFAHEAVAPEIDEDTDENILEENEVVPTSTSSNIPTPKPTPKPTPAPSPEPSPIPVPDDEPTFCTADAKICPDGSAVGRTGPKCEFSPCSDPPPGVSYCSEQSREIDACTMIYQPVCAMVRVECVTALCDPVPQTMGNACSACTNDRVISYTEGECIE